MISIIIPVYNEQNYITDTLKHLKSLDGFELIDEILVVQTFGERYQISTVISPKKGRAEQLNYGCLLAQGSILLFLHADTRLPKNAFRMIERYKTGAFSLQFNSNKLIFKFIGWMTTIRSKILRLPYGDQAIFIEKESFIRIGGFQEVPILEDVLLARKVKPTVLRDKVTTSTRRYIQKGILKTLILNRLIMLGFSIGITPKKLCKFRR